jgi:CheY-like chemotaxis protein
MQPPSQELINWTHEALKHFFDQPFLERHCRAAILHNRFADGRALQEALSAAVKQLRPPVQIPARSPAWRIYNVLNLRYVQGLTQPEAAIQLNIGSRQLRREQQKAIEAITALLMEQIGLAGQEPAPVAAPAEAQPVPREDEPIRLDELLRSALAVMDPLIESQRLTLELAMSGGVPLVRASRMVMRQMLISALNWLIHGVTGQTLGVEVQVHTGDCRVAIVLRKPRLPDTGDADPAREALDSVRRLAGMMRAEWRLSDAPGAPPGALTLQVDFPACETSIVAMIDDNVDAVQLVQRYLQQSGEFHLVAITDADEALQKVRALRPACILLDVMMPERDGWELLTLFRAYPETAGIPIIISSVLQEHELAHALGATDVLPKPFSAAQLTSVLRATIARAPRRGL